MRERLVPAHAHETPTRASRRAAAGEEVEELGPMARKTRSFVRRGGRLPANHQRAWDAHAAAFVLELPRVGVSTSVDPGYVLELTGAFGREAPLTVEVGSGAGDAVAAAALTHPERDYLAFEVYRPGVAQTLAKLGHHGLTNVRLAEVDAAEALATMLPPACADEVWTFFPDPWPKTKHHKRRLVARPFAEVVARVLRPGGRWRLATDWADYAEQMLLLADACGDLFEHPHAGPAPRFEGRVLTRFENRASREGRAVTDLELVRR